MTRTHEEIARALDLRAQGRSATEIHRITGIPRGTVSDWIRGRLPNLRSGADSCPSCGGGPHAFDQLPEVYVYLLGLYLGDGSIAAHHRGVYKLRLTLDPAYPRIIEEASVAMAEVLPTSRVGVWLRPSRDVEVYAYSKSWPCLFPQHAPGRKHLRPIVLAPWQEELVRENPRLLLRGLIQSDGCRFQNTGRNWRHPRYGFSNRSADIRRMFCDACDALDLHWTVAPHTIYVSRKADVARLDEFVGPKR